jgi:hypothetical protein
MGSNHNNKKPVILATQGGRDQEDHGSKLTQANSSQDPISKIPKKHTQKKPCKMHLLKH